MKDLEAQVKDLDEQLYRTNLNHDVIITDLTLKFEKEKDATFTEYYDYKQLATTEIKLLE